ncbi:metallophosphoesterase [Acinetobacter pittii]|uniref:metallophosphoesterase family protein n=1 Tax=Acinetobacter pittii TaxID=48296 RepID=UPI0026F11E25|nr:metallophosphoesterase [Acinetobacter pittii]MDO7244972.1 metallophosphoesterase [Acinetobacter pittii]
MNILHLTDLHFDSQTRLPALITALKNSDLMESIDPENTYLLITGDVATKGQNNSYQFAQPFIEQVFIQTGKIKRSNIILCPGNHDFARGSGLAAFNEFSRSVRDDGAFIFNSDNVILKRVDDILFCSLNSMYQYDRGHSSVDVRELARKLSRAKSESENCKHKIAILHHHLIGVQEGDQTTLQNGLPVLQILDQYGFKLVLHGHQHVQLDLIINNIQIMSGRSLLSPASFLTNGFNKIRYDESNGIFTKESYELISDLPPLGQLSLRKVS